MHGPPVPVEMGVLTALLTMLYGLLLLFAGRFLIKAIVSIGTGVFGGYSAYILSMRMGLGTLGSLVVFLLVFIVLSLIGWFIFKLAFSIVVSVPIWLTVAGLMNLPLSELPSILLLLLIIALIYIIAEPLVAVIAAVGGLLLVYIGASVVAGSTLALVITVLLGLLRVYLYTASKRWRI